MWKEIKSPKDLPDKLLYDWVLVAPILVPEMHYGKPMIAEYRDGEWWNDQDEKISDLSVMITHWIPLPAYTSDMLLKTGDIYDRRTLRNI